MSECLQRLVVLAYVRNVYHEAKRRHVDARACCAPRSAAPTSSRARSRTAAYPTTTAAGWSKRWGRTSANSRRGVRPNALAPRLDNLRYASQATTPGGRRGRPPSEHHLLQTRVRREPLTNNAIDKLVCILHYVTPQRSAWWEGCYDKCVNAERTPRGGVVQSGRTELSANQLAATASVRREGS